jgi:hypothetical protein
MQWNHGVVSGAKSFGILVPQPCEVCGEKEGVQAHHEDYDKPLDVKWLCHSHHRLRHEEIGDALVDMKSGERSRMVCVRIPDELHERIVEVMMVRGWTRTQVIIEALGAYLKQPTVIVAPPMSPDAVADFMKGMDDIENSQGKITAMSGNHPMCGMLPHGHKRVSMGAPPKNLKLARETKPKRALGRTPKNLSLADNRDARPSHAPGCKCLMCAAKPKH